MIRTLEAIAIAITRKDKKSTITIIETGKGIDRAKKQTQLH
jgi:sensor histidine kinase YesM